MARTDPPIKLKRSVLRRVVTTKLEALKRGDFYVRNHLGPECYDPIVAEAKAFLDSPTYASYRRGVPQDVPPPPSLSEDFDTFVQIIAASILIDASMRGENAGESDPRFIKKKKKLLTKTLRGVKFMEFTGQIWRFDCMKRGIPVPDEEESEEESSESNSSDLDDSDRDDTSVTSHTSADGFSTSASNSKKHHHGSSSGSQRKKHKKEKKKLKKERKHKRREERRRKKEEKRRKKLEGKKKKKRKREDAMEEEGEDEGENEIVEEEPLVNGKSEEKQEQPVETFEDESLYEIEHATKEEFEAFREDVLSKIPNKVKRRFREGGFSRWGKDWLPVLEIGPFDVEPGPVRSMWMDMFHNTRQSGREMTRLVFWYGVKYEDRGQAYSFVPSAKIISYEEGEKEGHCTMPKKIQAKLDKGIKLTKTEDQIERGLMELMSDMKKDKSERIRWMMHFQEDYELAESMPDPEPEPEPVPEPPVQAKPSVEEDVGVVKIKRKPGRPKKSESLKKAELQDVEKPIKRKPGRPKKSESVAAAAAPAAATDAPIKRKPGRPKKSEAEKAKAKEEKAKAKAPPKPKKFVIVDEDDDYALESDDEEDDRDYNDDSSNDSSVNGSEDADDELSNGKRKRRASNDSDKPTKKSKSNLSEVNEKEERRRKAAEYREKKRREKAEALGLDYVPGKKKSKTKIFEEEQKRFSECEDVFLPLIDELEKAKEDHNVKSVLRTIEKITLDVEMLTPPFLRTYPLGMLVRDVRKAFETSDPEVKEHCKRLTNEMKRVYNHKDKNTPDDFVPKKRATEISTEKSDDVEKSEPAIDVSMTDAAKTEDTTEPPMVRHHADTTTSATITTSYPDQALRTSEIVTTDPVKTDPVKSEPTRPPKKTFSIKGMFEKPKPIPKPKVTPAVIMSGPVSPKPKSLPAWVTGPSMKMNEFHEQHAKERNLALEFLNDAASSIPSNKIDPMSISQSLELAIFAETKLRGRDWNQYWEKVHDVVAMISPGKTQPNSIMLGIARGDYQDPSQLVTLSRREIHSLNQQRVKSLI